MTLNTANPNIQILKTHISLVDHIRSSGIELKAHGKDLIGLCPFHNDNNPSLVVTPSKNLWHCMGACNTGGSVIDWVMKYHGIELKEAIEKLIINYSHLFNGNGKKIIHDGITNSQELLNSMSNPIEESEKQKILKRCIDYFHRNIKQKPEALNYLHNRGLIHSKLLDEFKIGYADSSFTEKLPIGREGAELKKKLKQIGILTQTGRLFFNGCIVFPFFNSDSYIMNVYGRTITYRKKHPSHLYLAGANKGIFNHKALLSRDIILTESVIDALSFWVHGFYNVTCTYGANGYIKEIPEILKESGIDRVFLAYDNDEAGNKAVDTLSFSLAGYGIEAYKISFPKRLDANDYINRVKAPQESLKLLIQSAQLINDIKTAKKEKGRQLFKDILTNGKKSIPENKGILEKKDGAWYYHAGSRLYKILGLEKNLNAETLKIYLKVNTKNKFHLDNNIDLYASKDRKSFIKNAAEELELELDVIKKDVGNIIKMAEAKQAELIKESMRKGEGERIKISEQEIKEAITYLKDPDLINNIIEDFKKCGIVGEEENSLNGYIAATSRKEDRPLAVIIQSSSGAGKTTLMDAVINFIPDEDVVKFSAMTGQSLFYMGDKNLKNKILAIVEEEGAERASYSLKVLQSEGKISIASTGKNPETGRMVTQEYIVEGPVMLMITTTNYDVDEELLNRCIVLTINESREQTKKIHKIQRKLETLDGMFMELDRESITKLHQNIQRLLRPIRVHNPYAKYLTFIDTNYRARRDQLKYLTLIRTITLLHQYQRKIKTTHKNGRIIEFIETTIEDIELANRLAGKIFGTILNELPHQTRSVLNKIYEFVKRECLLHKIEQEDFRFSRREIREYLNTGLTQLRVHINRLVDYEYLVVHKGRKGQSFIYELVYNAEGEENLIIALGLFDTAKLRKKIRSKT
jgi:DNA primase catalytic core